MNVPKLRFKEFNDEWLENEIKNFGSIITGNTPPTNQKDNYGNEFLWVSPIDLGKFKYISNTKTKLSFKGFEKTRHIQKESILVTCIGSTIGKMGMASTEMSTNQQINSIICNDYFDSNYIYYSINFNFPKFLKKISFQAVPIISKSEFEKLKLKISSNKKEQEKIGTFLSLLDKKIELQSKKIEGLKLYKLSQIRDFFKNNNFESCKLKDIGQFISSNSIGKEKITNTGVPLILYGDLYTKYNETIQDIKQFCNDNEKYVKSELNDLIFPTSTTVDAISLISPSSVKVNGAVYGGDIIIFKPNIKDINSDFLSFEINNYLKKYFSTFAQGSTIIHIQADNLLNCNVLLPNIKIQTKLASCFNLYNRKIKLEEEKLYKLELLKKGFMQNMFV